MNRKLWEIGSELETIGVMIAENGGELTEGIEKRLEAIEGEFDDKVERIALLIRQMELDADAAKAEEDRLRGIRKAYSASAKSLKDYLLWNLRRLDRDRVDGQRARVRRYVNSNPSVEALVAPEAALPQYTKIKVEIDKTAVLRDWEQSSDDPTTRTAPDGFRIEYGEHVRIL